MADINPKGTTEEQVIEVIERLGGDGKAWYESKSMVFNALAVALGVAMLFGYGEHVAPESANEVSGTLVAIVSAVNMALRLVTKDPVR